MQLQTLTVSLFLIAICLFKGITSEASDIFSVGDALVAGEWRTRQQIQSYSEDDKRNTLIVEMEKHSSLTVPQLQGKKSYGKINSLVGMAAICIYLRDEKIRSVNQLNTMSDHDQRNTLIVELSKKLQAKGDQELVGMATRNS